MTELVQVPSQATVVASPRITTSGGTVSISGERCAGVGPGELHLLVRGESEDFDDLPET